MTLNVVARLVARTEKVEELKSLLSGLVELTRTEKGCLKYDLLQNQADPTDFTFVEEWASEADLEVHLSSTHFQVAASQLGGLITAGPDIRRYDKVL